MAINFFIKQVASDTPPAQLRGTLKGTNLRGQTKHFRRFSLILADSRLSLENEAFGKRRFSQKTADFRRKPQKTAGTRRKPQIGVCPLRFVPLSTALAKLRGRICALKFRHGLAGFISCLNISCQHFPRLYHGQCKPKLLLGPKL